MTRKNLILALLAASTALIGLLAGLPPAERYSKFLWEPRSLEDSGRIVLDRGVPERLVIQFDHDPTGNAGPTNPTLVSFGEWKLEATSSGAQIVTSESLPSATVRFDGCDSRCTVEIVNAGAGIKSSAKLYPLVDDQSAQVATSSLDFRAEISELVIHEAGLESSLLVYGETRPYGLIQTLERVAALSAVAVLLGFAGLLIIESPRRIADYCRQIRFAFLRARSRFAGPDLVVILGTFGFYLVLPAYSDDQWVIETTAGLEETGVLSSLFAPQAHWLPTGTLYYLINLAVSGLSPSFFSYRLLPLALLLISWATLRIILSWMSKGGPAKPLLWLSAVLFLALAMAWLMTLRPEPLLVALSSIFFLGAYRYLMTLSRPAATMAILSAGLAISTHQAGLVLLFPCAALVTILVIDAHRRGEWRTAFASALFVVSVLGLATFAIYDMHTIVEAIRDWRSMPSHDLGLLDEYQRWSVILSSDWQVRQYTGAWILVSHVLGLFAMTRSPSERVYILMLVAGPLGLFLTASKWEWHVGALAVPTVLLTFLLVRAGMGERSSFSARLADRLSLKAIPNLTRPVVAMVALGLAGSAALTFHQLNEDDKLRNAVTETTLSDSKHFGQQKANSSPPEIYAPCESSSLATRVYGEASPPHRLNPASSAECCQYRQHHLVGFWAPLGSDGAVPTLAVGGRVFDAWKVSSSETHGAALSSANTTVWAQILFRLPVTVSLEQVTLHQTIDAGFLASDVTQVSCFEPRPLRDVLDDYRAYGPVYDATALGSVDFLRSGTGIWEYPELVVAGRGLTDFASPLSGGHALELGFVSESDRAIYLFEVAKPKNLTITAQVRH